MSKTPTSPPIVEEDLHAFVDGALDDDRRREVQDHLDRNPDAAATVAALASQRQLLRSGLAHIADEPLPERLRIATLVANRRRPSPWGWQTAAAVVLALGAGAFGGWQMHGAVGQPGSGITALAGEARTSYVAYVSEPAAETAGTDLVNLVSDKLKRTVTVPDLSGAGYRYAGGRLVATGHGPAGLFFYERADGTRVALMVRPMSTDREAPMMQQSAGAVGGFTWAQRGLGYSVVGTEDLDLLHPIADEVRRQAGARPST